MIGTNVACQDIYVMASAYLTYQFPKSDSNITAKYLLAVLGDEYEVIVQIIYGMRGSSVFAHFNIVPQAS